MLRWEPAFIGNCFAALAGVLLFGVGIILAIGGLKIFVDALGKMR